MDTMDEAFDELEKKIGVKEITRDNMNNHDILSKQEVDMLLEAVTGEYGDADERYCVSFVDVIGWFNRANKGFSSYPKLVSRKAWDKDQYIFYVQGSTFQVNRSPLLGIFEEGKEISYHPHIDMHHLDGTISTWTPSSVDLFADDYYISNAPEEVFEEEIIE